MQPNLSFPYGITDFEQLVKGNFVYVDKTSYLEKLEWWGEYACYVRPPGFGKSLFVSMMQYYYDVLYKDRFQELFGNYYVGKNPTPLANKYRVLVFDFAKFKPNPQAEDPVRQGFIDLVRDTIKEFIERHQLFSQKDRDEILREEGEATFLLHRFFIDYKFEAKERLYLIFDNYDFFTRKAIMENRELVNKEPKTYMICFFEMVKSGTHTGPVDKILVTGCLSIAYDRLFSGFDILSFFSHDKFFEPMMGFLEEEVRSLLPLALPDASQEEAVMQELREYCNGYSFSEGPERTPSLYNPERVLYFLKHVKETGSYAPGSAALRLSFDTEKARQTFELGKYHEENKNLIFETVQEALIDGDEIATHLVSLIAFYGPVCYSKYVNILHSLGILSIKECSIVPLYHFKIPNKAVEELYWEYYVYLLHQMLGEGAEEKVGNLALQMAQSGNVDEFFAYFQTLLQVWQSQMPQTVKEEGIKAAIAALLRKTGTFSVFRNRQLQEGPPIDLELCPAELEAHHFALAIKYLNEKQENQKGQAMRQAQAQLLESYQKDEILQSKTKLRLLAAVIVKDTVYVEQAVAALRQ
jgi:hypothetical protein